MRYRTSCAHASRVCSTLRNKCVFIAAVAVAALLLMPASSSCCSLFFFFSSIMRLPRPSFSLARERAPAQMGPTDLHKAERARCPRAHLPLIKRARERNGHAHAYPLLRAQSAHERASRADTEAPRIPCCANNTTAHVRDISFYYYPRSLSPSLSPSPLLSLSLSLSFSVRLLSLPLPSLSWSSIPFPSSLSWSPTALSPFRARPLVHRVHDAVNFACADSPVYFTPPMRTRLSVLDLRQCSFYLRNKHT